MMDEKNVSKRDEIAAFLESLDFKKKTFGGCDKGDVLYKLQELAQMYQDCLSKAEESAAEAKRAQTEAEEKAEAALKAYSTLQNEHEELQQKVEFLMEERKSHEEKARLVADMEVRQKLERNEILIRAEHEARLIKERAEQDAITLRSNSRQKFMKEIKAKKELLENLNQELNAQICDMRAVLKVSNQEFAQMQITIVGLEERLNAYPPAMFIAEDEDEGEIYYVEEKEQ